MKSVVSFLAGAVVLLSPLTLWAEEGETDYLPDPLLLRSEALSQLFRNSPIMQKFKLSEPNDWRVMAGRTYSNFWGHDKRYIVDTETTDDQFRAYYQTGKYLELYGTLSQRGFSRMGTDGMAIGFHNIFGLPQDGRLEAPRDTVRVSVPDYDLNYSMAQKDHILSRQVELGTVWDFASQYDLDYPMTLAFYATRETAKGNPYFTGATDAGLSLNGALPLGRSTLYGTVSFTVFDRANELSISTYHQQWGGTFGGAYSIAANHETFLQLVMYQPIFQDMGQLSRASYEIHIAYRYKWEDVKFELGIVENVFWVYNSPDWGISAGITYQPKD
jgi:hypothetical protein